MMLETEVELIRFYVCAIKEFLLLTVIFVKSFLKGVKSSSSVSSSWLKDVLAI